MESVLHHLSERDAEGGRDGEDREDLHEIDERSGVLEGVRAVGVEVATTVGAQHLDRLLRGHGAAEDRLRDAVERRPRGGAGPGLDHALGDQEDGVNEAERQEHVEVHADEIDPEITELVGLGAGDAADERNRDADADSGREEVV